MQTKLTVELIPSGQWGKNLRSQLTSEEWDRLRETCYKKAGYQCEICGGKGYKWPVECHEIWHYDEVKKVQQLTGLIALCPACHEVKHMGRSISMGNGKRAKRHLMKVNGWSASDVEYYLEAIFELWYRRSNEDWVLDLKWLETK